MNTTHPDGIQTGTNVPHLAVWTPATDTRELPEIYVGRPRPAVLPCGPCTAFGPEGCTRHCPQPTAEVLVPGLRPPVTTRYRPRRWDLGGRLAESLRAARLARTLLGTAGLGFAATTLADTIGAVL